MTAFLPPNLLALFAPRDPIPYATPLDRPLWEKKPWIYSGVSQYLNLFEDPSETPDPTRAETKLERRERKRLAANERSKSLVEKRKETWDPHANSDATGDPFKTLFLSRVNFDSSESKLRREFEQYGPIRKIRLIYEKEAGKPRGYAFIEYERERDMHAAYKYADGKKIDGKRVLVDVERGRTVKGWLPRKLGGGLGGTRRGGPADNVKISGRDESYRDRDRGGERDQERDREPNRDRRGDRDRDRDRERGGDRDRDRGGDRDRDRERGERDRGYRDRRDDRDSHRHRRSRSPRDRDRRERRRRSRSRDRSRKKRSRSRSPRDRDRERKRHKERHDRDEGFSKKEKEPAVKKEKEMEEGEVV